MLIRKFEFPEEMVCPIGLDWNDNIVYGKKEIREHSIKIYDDQVEIMSYDYSTKLLFSSSKVSFEEIYEKTKVTELSFKGEITVRSVKEFSFSVDKKVITVFHTDSRFFKGIRWTFYYTSEAMKLIKEIINVIKDAYKKYVENYGQEKLLEMLEESNKKLLEIIEESNTQNSNEEPIKPKEIKAQEKDNFKFIVEDNMATIIGYVGEQEKISIPEKLGGAPVTTIGKSAFKDNKKLKAIDFPSTIKKIDDYAFAECSNLFPIDIPYGVIEIGDYAFSGCTMDVLGDHWDFQEYLEILDQPDEMLDEFEYDWPELGTIRTLNLEIPDTVTKIGDYAFSNCRRLNGVYVSENVKEIGNGVFKDCTYIKKVILPSRLKSIGDYAFSGCTSISYIDIPQGVTSIGEYAFLGCELLEQFSVPKEITSIREGAFSCCDSLEYIALPEGVVEIESSAFSPCDNLSKVMLPTTLQILGAGAFSECPSLEFIEIYGNVKVIEERAFSYCPALRYVRIHYGVTSIESFAFANCVNLEKIDIPASVKYIDEDAFDGCDKLKY